MSIIVLCMMMLVPLHLKAQIGEYRNTFAVGVNGGLTLSRVGFYPKVQQTQLPGYTGGISMRYTSEKYFKTFCSVYAEVNLSQLGWREQILDAKSQPVINTTTGTAEKYERRLNYVQVPVMAHLAWGKESKGCQFFFRAGPQFGYMLSQSTNTNFDFNKANIDNRANKIIAQDTMSVANKLDYGIAAGIGLEYSHPKVGHFLVEARYYYGLGNIFGASKRDYFSKSNNAVIELKLAYLIDINKRKK